MIHDVILTMFWIGMGILAWFAVWTPMLLDITDCAEMRRKIHEFWTGVFTIGAFIFVLFCLGYGMSWANCTNRYEIEKCTKAFKGESNDH